MKANQKVRIIEDCREGSPATGKFGVYEGDFPFSVMVMRYNDFTKEKRVTEHAYDWWMESGWTEYYPEYKEQEPKPESYWFAVTNPRIRLEDGSVIWGYECWWEPVKNEMLSLEESQKDLEGYKDVLRGVIEAMDEEE